MEFIGDVKWCGTIRKGTSSSGKEWQAYDFVVETREQYPKKCCLTVFGEEDVKKFGQLCRPGTYVNVQFDVDAREYNGRWYNSLTVWKMTPAQDPKPAAVAPVPDNSPEPPFQSQAKPSSPVPAQQGVDNSKVEADGDDLPF